MDGNVSAATLAAAVGGVAVVSAWTGWSGLALGVVALVASIAALQRCRTGRASSYAKPLVGLVLAVAAIALAPAVEWTTIQCLVTYLHSSQLRMLDECMRQAVNEREQHLQVTTS